MANQDQVLIVEDSRTLLRLYTTVLAQAGYTVLQAASGAAAQSLINTHHPDIVLLDRVLPDCDGNDICTWIKQTPALSSTYVIILSGLKTSEDDRVSGLEAGADDYLVKPVSKRELLARVKVAARLCSALRALAESEASFRTLAENSPDVIIRLDPSGNPLYFNPGIEQILGLPPKAVLEATRDNLNISEEIAAMWYAECQTVTADGQQRHVEFAFPSETGIRYFDTRLVPEFDSSGKVSSILAVSRDFTERVHAEQSIARLAAVVEQAVEAVIITSPQGTVQFVNAAFEQLTGYSDAALVGRNLVDVAPSQDGFYSRFLTAIAGNTSWQGVSYLRRIDGSLREIEATIFLVTGPEHRIVNYVALLHDLTERRRVEREHEVILTIASALRRAETRDEMVPVILNQVCMLFNASAAAFLVMDTRENDMLVELATGGFVSAIGMRFPAAGTLSAQMLIHGHPIIFGEKEDFTRLPWIDSNQDISMLFGIPLIAHNRGLGVLWVGCPGAITTHAQSLLVAIADIAATALHRVALYEELERYAAELEVRVANRTRELENANLQLLTLDQLKSKFVSNVSHELRTPISNLKLYMSLLQRGKPEKRAHYEDMLALSVDRLGQLVEDILNLSRLEIAHYQPRELAATDLNALIRQIVTLHQPQADATGLTLSFDTSGDLPLIDGDYNQLSQLFTNLLVNSLNYTSQGGVKIGTQFLPDQEQICVYIQDTGVGILPEDLPHLFERFYRGNHRQANDIPGTGLGLAIVQEIVDIHGGTINVSSQVDAGTCFEITLPIAQVERPTPE